MECPPGTTWNPRTYRCVKHKPTIRDFFGKIRRPKPLPVIGAGGLAHQLECKPGKERNPATRRCVKIGGLVHRKTFKRQAQPDIGNWKLLITRADSDFVSVLYVDESMAYQGPYGKEYPANSVRIDLGFVPINIREGQHLLNLIGRLANANRFLIAKPGRGWAAVGGFPFTKQYWHTDTARKIHQLYTDLRQKL